VSELLAVLFGIAGGVVSGLLGVGGGILFVPALAIFLDESQVGAEATSLLAIVPVAASSSSRSPRSARGASTGTGTSTCGRGC
jgi:uncharacterized protein